MDADADSRGWCFFGSLCALSMAAASVEVSYFYFSPPSRGRGRGDDVGVVDGAYLRDFYGGKIT